MADDLILASPVSGVLQGADGAPIAGATVERAWLWGKEEGKDSAVTGPDGAFSFDQVTGRKSFFGRLLPSQANISQTFTAAAGADAPRLLMQVYKSNYDLHGERNGSPLSIVCDYEAEPGGDGTFFFGTCRPTG
jgi:hypothetical protein